MTKTPKSPEHQAVVLEIQRLLALAEAGELPGAVLVLTMADGTRREYILGTMADLPPAELDSVREVLGELADGDTPGAGLPKH